MLRRLVLVLMAATFACGFPLHVVFGHAAHAAHIAGSASSDGSSQPCPEHSDKKGMTATQCGIACSVAVVMPVPPPPIVARSIYGVEFPPSPQVRVSAADLPVDPFPPRQRTRS
jgi:hypothetical protein